MATHFLGDYSMSIQFVPHCGMYGFSLLSVYHFDIYNNISKLQNLTTDEKAVYNSRAKGVTPVKEEKLDTRGVPIAWKEREEQQKITEKSQVFQKIEDMVSYLHTQEGKNLKYTKLLTLSIIPSFDLIRT